MRRLQQSTLQQQLKQKPMEKNAPKSAVPDDSLWQRDGWDTQLRSGELYHEKWEYVRMNPVRKLLTDDPAKWPFQGELNELLW